MNDYISVSYGNNVLVHHGILGQKWGVRRYQNEDGTRTEAGKKRYYKEMSRRQNLNNISDSELIERTNRLNRETQYIQAQKNRKAISKSGIRNFGEKALAAGALAAATAAVTKALNTGAPPLGRKLFSTIKKSSSTIANKALDSLGYVSISNIKRLR